MKAAVVHSFDRPLVIDEVPVPVAGEEQVLVRIETCGICHTDIHAARGDWPVTPSPPFIPGHEGVGIIEEVGPGNAHGLRRGERQLNTGYGIDGAFAEYAVGYARHVVRVPDAIDPADAADDASPVSSARGSGDAFAAR